ncbi:hypothetical protein PHMEG_00040947 [Phytophthora megakarya]|uniref:Elicitin n=1 Tax=Phytophthora megakarya TaxID=4795 RepID=A0A225UCD2_9STRA|nr:hypothetical protein PHMEG_00040947 [Phytophthora megakarya]
MVSTQSYILLIVATSALAFQGSVNATTCDVDNYTKVANAAQTLNTKSHLANGGVWTCDSDCHDAVSNLVNTLPDCTFGGPYGQNYKNVVESLVATSEFGDDHPELNNRTANDKHQQYRDSNNDANNGCSYCSN